MDDQRIIIIGGNGQLGKALSGYYPNAIAVSSSELDITDIEVLNNYDWSSVSTIINAAAYTNVDGAETETGRVDAWRVNATGAKNLALIAIAHDLLLIHISTDYVFNGTITPHFENESFSPLGVYGQTKAAGDIAVSLAPKNYIVRTSWVIGDGKNFVRTMLDLRKRGVSPKVVADQVGRLTFISELVRGIDHLIKNNAEYGTYNISNSGDESSWADITRLIFEIAGYSLMVTDTTTEEYFADNPNSAPRPLNSLLDLSKIQSTSFVSSDWKNDLKLYIEKELQA